MTYSELEKARATAWKTSTTALSDEARAPAQYVNKDGLATGPLRHFCIPPYFAAHNLLEPHREAALSLFAELGIPWHAAVASGPSNHLVSSQVQCVNALMPLVGDPSRVVRAFGELLGIGEVLQIEPGRYLTFEYIGPTDYFGESPAGERIRGAHCTSVDAAFLHRATDGVVELVLLEWKYTESYRLRTPDPTRDLVRLGRYGAAVTDPSGPVRAELLSFEHLLDEPFYQLVRQQLLAHALETAGAEGASRVRVLHVLPAANDAYQQSLARPEHRTLGSTVNEVWQRLLRHTDRFISVDSDLFLNPQITSREYQLRHSDGVVHDTTELLAALEAQDAEDLAGVLDFHGFIELYDDLVDLVLDREGTGLAYPFHIDELLQLADELAAGDG